MKNVLVILALIVSVGMAQAQSNEKEVKIMTSAVCGMCKKAIEKDMAFEKGVNSSSLDVKSKVLTVKYNPKKTNPDKIRQAVARVGYDADEVPANKKAFDKLDECCKKSCDME